MPRVLLVDNYDSFTFNLAQALWSLGAEVEVHRNDAITISQALTLRPSHLVISPGPGRPEGAGVSIPMIKALMATTPVLGVCLGHQALAVALGGTVSHAPRLMHGKSSPLQHGGDGLFEGLPNPMQVARYHSLIVTELPPTLQVCGRTAEGEVMAIRHLSLPTFGVQFHPESVLCPEGPALLANFLRQGAP